MITIICGVAGKGKTALATQLALAAASKGMHIFSNYTISYNIFGVELTSNIFDMSYFKERKFPPNSYIIVDECQNDFNSRYFKDMSREEMEYFTGHRHLGNELILTTPHPNRIDVVLRECCDKFIFIRFGLPFGFKWCYEYPIADYVGRIPPEVPEPYFKKRLFRVRKATYTKYDDKYLRDKLSTNIQDLFSIHNYKRSKYIPLYSRIYIAIKNRIMFLKGVLEMKKHQKVDNVILPFTDIESHESEVSTPRF